MQLKEFLISIGYGDADDRSWSEAMAKTEKAVGVLSAALAASAAAVAALVVKTSQAYDSVNYSAQRTGSSVASFQALTYALKQVGLGGDAAGRALNGLAERLRTFPSTEGLIRQLGVQTRVNGSLRDTTDILLDAIDALSGRDYVQAVHWADQLGISEADYNQLRARSADIRRFKADSEALAKSLGVDRNKLGANSTLFMASYRLLTAQFSLVVDAFAIGVAPALGPIIDRLNAWIQAHEREIIAFVEAMGRATVDLVRALGKVNEALAPLWAEFFRLIEAMGEGDGLGTAIKAIGGVFLASVALRFMGPVTAVVAAMMALAGMILATTTTKAQASISDPVRRGIFARARAGQKRRAGKQTFWGRVKSFFGFGGGEWGAGGAGEPFNPATDGKSSQSLAEERERFAEELKNPAVAARLAAYTEAEVGNQGAAAQQAFIESTMNRAAARGKTLEETLSGSYFPAITHQKALQYANDRKVIEKYRSAVESALGGSNVSGYATGNASGSVGFGGGPQTSTYGGERFGVEKLDEPWAVRIRARERIRDMETKPKPLQDSHLYNFGDPFNVAALGTDDASFDGRIVQTTTIMVQGDADPNETVRAVTGAQQRTNTAVLNKAQEAFA